MFSGSGLCKYDAKNFQHMCMLVGKPCAHVGHIDNCPYLAAEKAPAGEGKVASSGSRNNNRNSNSRTIH